MTGYSNDLTKKGGQQRSLSTAVGVPAGVARDRLRLLADAGLVAFATNDYDLVHLTTSGALYLEGERD